MVLYSRIPHYRATRGKQNGTVLWGHSIQGAGIGGFTVNRKNGRNDDNTLLGRHGIRGVYRDLYYFTKILDVIILVGLKSKLDQKIPSDGHLTT